VYAVQVRSFWGRQRFGATLPARVLGTVALVLAFSVASSAVAARKPGGDEATVHWKQITEGQVKLDDKPPIGSNLYQQVQKKGKIKDPNLVLILLGHRYLLLDIKAKTVYQVLATDLKAQGSDFDSGDLAQDSRIIPTSDWSSRDVGPAQLISMTLGDYGRTLEIEIPHLPDLRAFY
jgi:hypothetical protein